MISTMPDPVRITRQADMGDPRKGFIQDVGHGLNRVPKRLSSVYFYDEEGSRLFEEICDLPEYYLTRKEREILELYADDLMKAITTGAQLVELGSGSSSKTRILIEAGLRQFGSLRYSPIDVSEEMLSQTARLLQQKYESLQVEAYAGFYEFGLEQILQGHYSPKCIMWLGSSIGNLTREEATTFLSNIAAQLNASDHFLLGVDLRKSPDILEPAYDDAAGVTAQFNLNLLRRINDELGGEFDLRKFAHRARYDVHEGRIEMYLDSVENQDVIIKDLGQTVAFEEGEAILTEYSYKYSLEEIHTLAEASGFTVQQQWLDKEGLFSLSLFNPNK